MKKHARETAFLVLTTTILYRRPTKAKYGPGTRLYNSTLANSNLRRYCSTLTSIGLKRALQTILLSNKTMVRQTTHLGSTSDEAGQNQMDVAQGAGVATGGNTTTPALAVPKRDRYPEIYESTRGVKDWEMSRIAYELHKDNRFNSVVTQFLKDIVQDSKVSDIYVSYRKEGDVQVTFRTLLYWRKNTYLGLGPIGVLAKALKKHGFADLAESFLP
ncbi:hypothetical protein CHS0354_024829 [Potamilus streckersoni]|uniref:Uncharacterized protein n=1 Tax=Potamilus streckersoni TaxID=2493646 RepID=A0AAE0W3V6_9BIVA|nr:hypothetical protein CHS0354_024829 [Potamilus streckersoni]